jgi:hypothetical protein
MQVLWDSTMPESSCHQDMAQPEAQDSLRRLQLVDTRALRAAYLQDNHVQNSRKGATHSLMHGADLGGLPWMSCKGGIGSEKPLTAAGILRLLSALSRYL